MHTQVPGHWCTDSQYDNCSVLCTDAQHASIFLVPAIEVHRQVRKYMQRFNGSSPRVTTDRDHETSVEILFDMLYLDIEQTCIHLIVIQLSYLIAFNPPN